MAENQGDSDSFKNQDELCLINRDSFYDSANERIENLVVKKVERFHRRPLNEAVNSGVQNLQGMENLQTHFNMTRCYANSAIQELLEENSITESEASCLERICQGHSLFISYLAIFTWIKFRPQY